MKVKLLTSLQEIATKTGGNVILIGVTHLDLDVLPKLYELLGSMEFRPRLDVILYTKGGDVNATRRIALLLREYCTELHIHAPYYCQSSGTLLCMSADNIYFSVMSMFSAIDPHLHGSMDDSNATALSSADIKHFSQMSEDWFNCYESANKDMLAMLCQSIFPPTLTAFYRTVKEAQQIAHEMLSLSHSLGMQEKQKIIDKLMFGYFSHEYCITGEEMNKLGLNFIRDRELSDITWDIANDLSNVVGGGNRNSLDDPWCDGILSNSFLIYQREKSHLSLKPKWCTLK